MKRIASAIRRISRGVCALPWSIVVCAGLVFLPGKLVRGQVLDSALVNPAAIAAGDEPLPLPAPLPEVVEGLTLQQLEELALTGNPTICRAYAMVGAARGNWIQVGLKPNPSVGYEGQQLGSGGQAEQHGVLF